MKNYENDVYVIGGKKRVAWLRYAIIVLCIAAGVILIGWLTRDSQEESGQVTQELNAIEVLPENAMSPKFDGQYDFSEFLKWVSSNLGYPQGLETMDAEVKVSFVVTKEGHLADIKIVSEPAQKEFGQQVVKLLKTCPKWAPARMADGTPASISYTLPVKFRAQNAVNE